MDRIYVDFVWDDNKDAANQDKHGIDFETATTIFDGPVLTFEDDRKDYGEVREVSCGVLATQIVAVVVHTDRQGRIRIISARKADRDERQRYEDWVGEA